MRGTPVPPHILLDILHPHILSIRKSDPCRFDTYGARRRAEGFDAGLGV